MNSLTPGADLSTPSVARAYDYVLGGKDNFEIDRQFANQILKRDPEAGVSAKLNKEFGRRATRFMAQQGISQFLDLGSGIPTSPPAVHDSARAVEPFAKVVYVDHDPVVVAHNRALRAVGDGLTAIQADFTKPHTVLEHPETLTHLDFSEPMGVLILSVFQNTADDADVMAVLRKFREQMVPGSFMAITHISTHTPQEVQDQITQAANQHGYPPTVLRSQDQVDGFFEGFDIVEPGVVDHRDWRPDDDTRPHIGLQFLSAVGRLR